MPLGASAKTALQVGNRILSASASVDDGLTPRQRRNKRNYSDRKKKRSRVLFTGTQPQSSSSELSGDFDGSPTLEVTEARALGHAPPTLSSSEEDPLDEEEAQLHFVQATHRVEMRRQLLHQALALRNKEQEEHEQEEPDRIEESGDQQPDVLSDSSSSNTDSSTEAVLTADEVLIKMSPEFMAIVIQFDISHTAAAAMWNFVVNNGHQLHQLQSQKMERGKSYATVRRIAEKSLPPIRVLTCHKNIVSGEEKEDRGSTFPKKKYKDRNTWRILYEIYSVDVKHFVELHKNMHSANGLKCSTDTICFSGDGVPESKQQSVDIFSIRFDGCRTIYNIKVVKKYKGAQLTASDILGPIFNELNELKIRVRLIIADAPQRAWFRCQNTHNAVDGCDYCGQIGQMTAVEREPRAGNPSPAGRARCSWPWEEGHALRTHDEVKEIQERLGRGEVLDRAEAWGYKVRSPLLDLPGFDIILDVPAETMHLWKGMVEGFINLTFRVNTTKIRKSRLYRIPCDWINDALAKVRLPSDLSRRTRAIDNGYIKTEELRNWALILFPLFADAIGEQRPEYEIWLLMCLLMRCYAVPTEASSLPLPDEQILEAHKRFHEGFGQFFGVHNLVYNPHVFTHMRLVRSRGLVTDSSATDMEASYSLYRKNFVAGTVATPKQALLKALIKKYRTGHHCERSLKFEPAHKRTSQRDDSIMYTAGYKFYKIINMDNDRFQCHRIRTRPYTPGGFEFHRVGVAILNWVQDDIMVDISRAEVLGKGALIQNPDSNIQYVVAIPINVLNEGHSL